MTTNHYMFLVNCVCFFFGCCVDHNCFSSYGCVFVFCFSYSEMFRLVLHCRLFGQPWEGNIPFQIEQRLQCKGIWITFLGTWILWTPERYFRCMCFFRNIDMLNVQSVSMNLYSLTMCFFSFKPCPCYLVKSLMFAGQ